MENMICCVQRIIAGKSTKDSVSTVLNCSTVFPVLKRSTVFLVLNSSTVFPVLNCVVWSFICNIGPCNALLQAAVKEKVKVKVFSPSVGMW